MRHIDLEISRPIPAHQLRLLGRIRLIEVFGHPNGWRLLIPWALIVGIPSNRCRRQIRPHGIIKVELHKVICSHLRPTPDLGAAVDGDLLIVAIEVDDMEAFRAVGVGLGLEGSGLDMLGGVAIGEACLGVRGCCECLGGVENANKSRKRE